MLAERPKIEQAITAVCQREGYSIQRLPDEHAGGKWHLRYDGALGQGGHLALDINFLLRVPLRPIVTSNSCLAGAVVGAVLSGSKMILTIIYHIIAEIVKRSPERFALDARSVVS